MERTRRAIGENGFNDRLGHREGEEGEKDEEDEIERKKPVIIL